MDKEKVQIKIISKANIQIVAFDWRTGFSIGNGARFQYRIPVDSSSITLRWEQGYLTASCTGHVTRNGQRISSAAVSLGDVLVLDMNQQIAIQIIETYPLAAQLTVSQIAKMPDGIKIGRNADNHIQIDNKMVSAHHAVIYAEGANLCVKDCKSYNGTYVNGMRKSSAALGEGSRIYIDNCQMLFKGGTLYIYGKTEWIQLAKQQSRAAQHTANPAKDRHVTLTPRQYIGMPEDSMEIEAAPLLGARPEINWVQVLLPALGSFAVMMVMGIFTGTRSAVFTLPLMLVGVVVTIYNYKNHSKKYAEMEWARTQKYESYLAECERRIQQFAQKQREVANSNNPDAKECFARIVSRDSRLWERTAEDEDFLSVRAGTGSEPIKMEIKTPRVGFMLQEDAYTFVPEKIAEKYRVVDNIPVICDLFRHRHLAILGKTAEMYRFIQAMLVSIAANHGYQELKIAVFYYAGNAAAWDWMRYLPHVFEEGRNKRYMAADQDGAKAVCKALEDELAVRKERSSQGAKPYYLVIVENQEILSGSKLEDYLKWGDEDVDISSIWIAGRSNDIKGGKIDITIDLTGGQAVMFENTNSSMKTRFAPDGISIAECQKAASLLAPLLLPDKSNSDMLPTGISLLEGYGVRRVEELNIGQRWNKARCDESMAVPMGRRVNGENFYFDMNCKKHGAHGMVAGMARWGKSETIQSWIASMAINFSPQSVSFVLVDFKGTSLFEPFKNLPHLAGTISNLDAENISRNLVSLKSEVTRRENLFAVNAVPKIEDYIKKYRNGEVSEPLSYLFVIIDEYATFKQKYPEFTEEVNALFCTGASLGIYMMLATQNPSGIVTEQSESNIRYRWGLRVAQVGQSREFLGGHGEAAYLNVPGRAYIRVGEDEIFELIQAFYGGAEYQPEKGRDRQLVLNKINLCGDRKPLLTTKKDTGKNTGLSENKAVADYICEYTRKNNIPPARQIWTKPLPAQLVLDDIIREYISPQELSPVIGMIDDPVAQEQRVFRLCLSANGHAVIYGGPQSGKTTCLQTLLTAVGRMENPENVNIYIMDFGNWTLGMFKDFPQVGGVAFGNDRERVEKIGQMLDEIMDTRKYDFVKEGVGSLKGYRQVTGRKIPYIILAVDNFAAISQLYPNMDNFFTRLVQEGANYGVYLVVTVSNAAGLGYKLSQYIKTKLVLNMTDASDYVSILGKTDGLKPDDKPGRGLYREKYAVQVQIAMPDDAQDENALGQKIRNLAGECSIKWAGKRARSIPVMPTVIEYGSIPLSKDMFMAGLSAADIEPVGFDLRQQHFITVSAARPSQECGLLKLFLRQIHENENCQIFFYGKTIDLEGYLGSAKVLADSDSADRFFEENKYVLTERRNQAAGEGADMFEYRYILIRGFRQFFDAVEQETAKRIQALVRLGQGLKVVLVVTDTAQNLAELSGGGEQTVRLLLAGPVLLAGGTALDHMEVSVNLPYDEKDRPIAEQYIYVNQENKTVLVKQMKADMESA